MLHTLQKYCKYTLCPAAYMSQVHYDAHISAIQATQNISSNSIVTLSSNQTIHADFIFSYTYSYDKCTSQ